MWLTPLISRIRPYYEHQEPGHDWNHILRVIKTCQEIGDKLNAQMPVLLAAAYLHDIVNIPKNHPDRSRASELAADKAVSILTDIGAPADMYPTVRLAVLEHSYSKGLKPSTLEAAILQDADRLDAIGAIGILRCAGVATEMRAKFYHATDPMAFERELDDKHYMLDHYTTKLFKLSDTLNTEAAKEIAKARVEFMHKFMDQLLTEIPSAHRLV